MKMRYETVILFDLQHYVKAERCTRGPRTSLTPLLRDRKLVSIHLETVKIYSCEGRARGGMMFMFDQDPRNDWSGADKAYLELSAAATKMYTEKRVPGSSGTGPKFLQVDIATNSPETFEAESIRTALRLAEILGVDRQYFVTPTITHTQYLWIDEKTAWVGSLGVRESGWVQQADVLTRQLELADRFAKCA